MFKKGEKVLIKKHTNLLYEPNKIWECETDEYKTTSNDKVVKLKGYTDTEISITLLEPYRAVYKLNDYDWYITSWTLEDTIKWYNEHHESSICIHDIDIYNIDNEGMWVETTESNDISNLKNAEILPTLIDDQYGKRYPPVKFGDLTKGENGSVFKFKSFKDVINDYYLDAPILEPELIASIR